MVILNGLAAPSAPGACTVKGIAALTPPEPVCSVVNVVQFRLFPKPGVLDTEPIEHELVMLFEIVRIAAEACNELAISNKNNKFLKRDFMALFLVVLKVDKLIYRKWFVH